MSNKKAPENNLKHYFPSMVNQQQWIGVAFKKGSLLVPYEALIMSSTFGTFVHCELILGHGSVGDVYASYDTNHEGCGFQRSTEPFTSDKYVVITLPLKDDGKTAHTLALRLIDLKLPYNSSDLWQCCIKAMLPFESDLDCEKVDTWKGGVFCSQMCLLFMRNLVKNKSVDFSPALHHHLENVHSRGCSPNALYNILASDFKTI